jgi:hypothetical protein
MKLEEDPKPTTVGGKTFKVFNLRRSKSSGGGGFNIVKFARLASISVMPVLAIALVVNNFKDEDQSEVVASAIELGEWEDEFVLRGGEEDSNVTELPSWVSQVGFKEKSDRTEWLDQSNSEKLAIKVWLDEDGGVFKVHRPGVEKPEEIALDSERSTREQLLELLDRLKEEIDP